MKVLVTGSDGFTGQHLIKRLEENQVSYMALQSDLLCKKTLEIEIRKFNPTHVCHLAGISFANYSDVNNYYNVNLLGTINLLEILCLLEYPKLRVIIASSAAIYGNNKEGKLDEKTVPEPHNHYSMSKYLVENCSALYSTMLDIVIVRPFNYTGLEHNSRFLIPKIIDHFKCYSSEIELGNTEVYREFGDVRDVVEYYYRLLVTPRSETIFNICTGKMYTIKDILCICEEQTGHVISIKTNNALIRDNEPKVLIGDPSKLIKHTKYIPRYNIEDTVCWMLKN
jgi:GDP-6-deoxy-D-talose 4-dehydrogenase